MTTTISWPITIWRRVIEVQAAIDTALKAKNDWVNPRTIKESLLPATDYRYGYMTE